MGVHEHALFTEPRSEHGYCTDDVARALVVVMREDPRPAELERLAETCLAFLEHAQLPDGRFHNRREAVPPHRLTDAAGSDDSIGRALWGLGAAAASFGSQELRGRSLACFTAGAGFVSSSPRANATAALGAVEVLGSHPGHEQALALLEAASTRLGSLSPDPLWPWTEERLAYENAHLAEARIAAGMSLGRRLLVDEGLLLLDWLVRVERRDTHFSFTPVGGWALGEPRPAFDQQPIEAAAMADACARAYEVTGAERWAQLTVSAAEWFLGSNDIGVSLLDPASGGGHDGLEAGGTNENQGAESTISLIGALQCARRVATSAQAAARSAPSTSASTTLAAPTQLSAAP